MDMQKEIQKGFTLIELLVVIAIIGILAGILFVAIDPLAQNEKATDAKKLVFVNQLTKALELYKFQKRGNRYPAGDSGRTVIKPVHFETDLRDFFKFDLSDVFNSNEFLYRSIPPHQSYTIAIKLDDTDKMKNDNGVYDDWYEVGVDVKYCKDDNNKASFDKNILYNTPSNRVRCFAPTP